MQSFKALFQEVQISSLIDWMPSDFKYIPKVLNIVTEYKTCGSKLAPCDISFVLIGCYDDVGFRFNDTRSKSTLNRTRRVGKRCLSPYS